MFYPINIPVTITFLMAQSQRSLKIRVQCSVVGWSVYLRPHSAELQVVMDQTSRDKLLMAEFREAFNEFDKVCLGGNWNIKPINLK